ncbi:MAG: hypothetical protein U0930_24865 [Pirellulales bacterium]
MLKPGTSVPGTMPICVGSRGATIGVTVIHGGERDAIVALGMVNAFSEWFTC